MCYAIGSSRYCHELHVGRIYIVFLAYDMYVYHPMDYQEVEVVGKKTLTILPDSCDLIPLPPIGYNGSTAQCPPVSHDCVDNNIEAQSLVTTETTDTRRTYDGYIIATLTYPVLCTKEQKYCVTKKYSDEKGRNSEILIILRYNIMACSRIKPLTDHEIERRMQEAAIFVTNPNDIFDANTNELPENICKSSGLSTNHVYLTTVLLPTIAHFCVHATITSWSDMINHFILYTIIIGNPSAGKLRFHCPLS
ncbi:unnamed protein product [Didymodactylos carnosus]|uniref:Uncharacterized protein n=1 Tax=Didymodactylos carnosus TaxID=1234261 RepID=A0A815PKZ4_9BILA|nr:unnamed protein product [Didymodactylos carnosus]CAF4324257.1 unnamed protein product [Didymodactylos carnosus]